MEDKMKDFAISLAQMSMKESKILKEELEEEVNIAVEEEIREYSEKKQTSYKKLLEKTEKEHNKKIFAYELQLRQEVINEENKIKQEIKKEAIQKIKEAIENNSHIRFLENKIEECLNLIGNIKGTRCGIIRLDKEKYEKEILQKYQLEIFEISEKYIGGCILENQEEGIYIDNTILNLINEKI